jgi:NCS1 family nucleobase:cation symporter-1
VVIWTNIFSLTILVTLCAILGVVVTSSAQVIYGVSTWSPLQVSSLMGSRAAQFFSAFMWGIAVLSTNSSANSTAVGKQRILCAASRGPSAAAMTGWLTSPLNLLAALRPPQATTSW